MDAAIAAPRDDVRDTAPKIVSFEIPIDKIGEVIGPKGKVINTIQQETGADISVQRRRRGRHRVSIGSKDGAAVEEAQRRIELILDPPTAELGAEYTGRVVNITKFGAFVNILPGRDGLLHISKLGRGKRIDRVEDVLNLGDEVTVRVDDIDQTRQALALARRATTPTAAAAAAAERRRRRGRDASAASRVDASDRERASRRRPRRRRAAPTPSDRVVRGVLGGRRPARSSATSVRPRPAARRSRWRPRWRARGGGGGGGGRRWPRAAACDRSARDAAPMTDPMA